ncbi:Hypothetical predicted protein [Pelobates cultripes]|uniref:Uncharacterized protein n=1 Tax=Pelobates cultripes TaxID=61616 RepID=A0AAD1WJS1_PELCU|nr:Hypothetical predicted protein [Pelobates cultripes]
MVSVCELTKKSQVCLWRDLTVQDLDVLQKTNHIEEFHRTLSQILGIEGSVSEWHAPILLDLFYYTWRFCQRCRFSKEQTSCLFSIVKDTHSACAGCAVGNPDDCFRHFQELLRCHAVHRPPFSVNLFTQQQIEHISGYFLNTYFRHFKLYKYVFTPQVSLQTC